MGYVTDPADPRRCRGIARSGGQCSNVAIQGQLYCSTHGGTEADEATQYLLDKVDYNQQVAQVQSRLDPVYELERAISSTALLLTKHNAAIKSDAEFLAAGRSIQELTLTLAKLSKTLISVQQELGSVLAKETAIHLARRLADLIIEEFKETPNFNEKLDRFLPKFFDTITKTKNTTIGEANAV